MLLDASFVSTKYLKIFILVIFHLIASRVKEASTWLLKNRMSLQAENYRKQKWLERPFLIHEVMSKNTLWIQWSG